MIKLIWYLALVIFVLKLLWNIGMPVAAGLAHLAWKRQGGRKPGHISMAPVIELILWPLLTVLSGMTNDGFANFGPAFTLSFGLVAMLISYALMGLAGACIRKCYERLP